MWAILEAKTSKQPNSRAILHTLAHTHTHTHINRHANEFFKLATDGSVVDGDENNACLMEN